MNKQVFCYEERNNGYGCGCCGKSWTKEEWMDESDMYSLEELITKAWGVNPLNGYGDTTDLYYEDETGNTLYGYYSSYDKETYCVSFVFGKQTWKVIEKGSTLFSREEFSNQLSLLLENKGGFNCFTKS